jgi:hypothetical protein
MRQTAIASRVKAGTAVLLVICLALFLWSFASTPMVALLLLGVAITIVAANQSAAALFLWHAGFSGWSARISVRGRSQGEFTNASMPFLKLRSNPADLSCP